MGLTDMSKNRIFAISAFCIILILLARWRLRFDPRWTEDRDSLKAEAASALPLVYYICDFRNQNGVYPPSIIELQKNFARKQIVIKTEWTYVQYNDAFILSKRSNDGALWIDFSNRAPNVNDHRPRLLYVTGAESSADFEFEIVLGD
jgi:hypothetical protein